jgi:NAD(P)-dependent dehydrogenase (short-subunit alcohol dehydrogenase family)
VVQDHDLSGCFAVVTGAASGIGVETARGLAGAGAAVTPAIRNAAAGERVATHIRFTEPGAVIDVQPVDLMDLASVDRFTATWLRPLHLLVNKAGVMSTPLEHTGLG